MTNKIAIEYLKDMLASAEANLHVPDMAEHAEALNMAIEALSNSQNQSDSLIRTSADDVSEADVIYRADAIVAISSEPLYRSGTKKRDAGVVVPAIYEKIKSLPSAQPEIIRCKDCKKYDTHDHRCKHWNHGVVVMDWCSRAERKDNG